MSIKDWHEENRPREKLLRFGPASLQDAELLAIFLRTGVPGQDAVSLSRELLQKFGSLNGLLGASLEEFTQGKGLGQAKYVQLQATLEMAKRYLQGGLQQAPIMDSPQKIKDYLALHLAHESREVFGVVLLNSQHALIVYQPLFFGTINAAEVHPREVVKLALQHNAAAAIVAHNHPSGNLTPSRSDIAITRKLAQALDLIDVRLLDHIILARGGGALSLRETGDYDMTL